MNDIAKNPKELQDVRKVVPQRRPGPPFWVPGRAIPSIWASLDPMLPHSAARVDFWTIADLILRFILNPKTMKYGVDFR